MTLSISGIAAGRGFQYADGPSRPSQAATAGAECKIQLRRQSLAARETRRDLLDDPQIAVGIVEGAERPVAGALGVGAGLARFDGERRAVPHVTDVDAELEECVVGLLDVGDDEGALDRARGGRGG